MTPLDTEKAQYSSENGVTKVPSMFGSLDCPFLQVGVKVITGMNFIISDMTANLVFSEKLYI